MKQTTKNILGVAAIVLLSSGVAGLTTYKMLNKEKPAAFSELFQQNPNNLLPAAFHAMDAQPVDLRQAAEGLYLALASTTVSKEEVKNIRLFLHRLGLTQLSGAYMPVSYTHLTLPTT